MSNRRLLYSSACIQAVLTALSAAHAADAPAELDAACRSVSLDAGEISQALEKLSKKTGVSVVVDHRLIAGRTAPAVAGEPDCASALSAVLAETDLEVRKINNKTFAISQRPAPADISAPPDVPFDMHRSTSLQDEIIVTGSRLLLVGVGATSPVLHIDGNEIDTRGATRVEDFLNILPQAFAGQTSEVSNGATGTSNLNLRGLGAIRTLVLLDGKRLPFGSPQTSAVNLDLIPAQLVERVDIVTGGQSAVYGSDAVAGVANFILRRDFEGVMFDGQVGFFQDGNNNNFADALLDLNNIERPGATLDGRDVNVSVTFGATTGDGRGNVTAFFSYLNQNEIRQSARDYSTCPYGAALPGPASINGVACIGSSSYRRFFTPNGDFFLQENGTFVPYTGAPEQTFNFAPDNFIQRPLERFSANMMAHYEVADHVEAYFDFGFTKNATDAQIAASGTFFRPFRVNCDNPYLDASVSTGGTLADALGCDAAAITAGADVPLTVGYRNVEGDPRNAYIDLETFRVVAGFRGRLGDDWSWDVSGQYAHTDMTRISEADFSFDHVQDALFAVSGPDGPVCRSGAAACVPYNIFQRGPRGESLVDSAAVSYLQSTGYVTGFTEQRLLNGVMQGDLGAHGVQSPWAASGVQALIGAEYREDVLDRRPDDVSQIPGGLGLTGVAGGALPVSGEVRVAEFFMETQIPLVSGEPLIEELGVNGAYRYSDYTSEGNGVKSSFSTHTFAAGVSWAPTQAVRFRAQFQRAVRAPNVIELFTGQNTALFNLETPDDPCAGATPTATAAQCAFTGVTPSQYGSVPTNSSDQFNAVTGGNPFLDPEKSNAYTAGAIFTPSFAPDLSLAVDYFNITVKDAISIVPPHIALDQCLEAGREEFCKLIVRDRFGSLFLENSNFEGVQAINTNILQLSTSGVDVTASYSYDFGEWGSVNWKLSSAYLLKKNKIPLPGVTAEIGCAGIYAGSCDMPSPKYRHRLLTTWRTPWNTDIIASWRYYGSVGKMNGAFGAKINDHLDSANYLDIAAQWYVRDNVTLRAGVQNVFGRDPDLQTLVGPALGNGNTLPGVYDPAGRYIFFGVSLWG